MSHFETHLKSILTCALIALSATSALAQSQKDLPLGIQDLIFAEQNLLSRDLNEKRIMTPKDNKQEDRYKPENHETFTVKSYWIKKTELDVFASSHMSKKLEKVFHRKLNNGQEEFLILVHPESESLYADIVKSAKPGPTFWATPTSSSRTLLMWPDSRPDLPFFGKLSLNKKIGGVVRTIPQGEVSRSLGVTEILYKNQSVLPKSFKFFPESFSLIPKGMERGGMILREIPEDVASGKSRYIPLFSLYAERGDQPPLLAEMIKASKMPANEFVKNNIIDPFIKQWVEMVLVRGISMEPHAQNVLIGINSQGMPNGEFMHRDFGGFNIDLNKFSALNMLTPEKLPTINGINEDYHQKFSVNSVNQSIEVYFEQGFVYNLNQKLPLWTERGWIAKGSTQSLEGDAFSKMLYESLRQEIARITDGKVQATRTQMTTNLNAVVENARSKSTQLIAPRCEVLFRLTTAVGQ